jgi:hypothetical protein
MTIPTTPAEWQRLLSVATDDERREIEAILEADLQNVLWRPQVGRQSQAADSEAFVTGYGGAAGGGKSDLIAGLALLEHKRSVVFRKEKVQTEGIIQRLGEILGSTDGYSSQKSAWRVGDSLIEFGGLDNPNDHQKWQGRAHDLKAYDEVTEMREAQVRFTMGWTRSPDAARRSRVLMTFNPPTTAEGRWVIDYFAPWLDVNHPNPAENGEIRWYTTVKGKDLACPDNQPFVLFKGEPVYDFDPSEFTPEKIIKPRSRTFIKSLVTDNYFYVRSGYIETLQSMPEPLRSQMLSGDFMAGAEDDPWQVIPTVWIDAAMERWQPRDMKGPMDSLGVDVACGGSDSFVMAPRHGTWFDELVRIPGREIAQETAGTVGAGHVVSIRRDRAPVHIDMIGWGLTVHNALTENKIQTIGVNAANGTKEVSLEGGLGFLNVRALLVWRMREALDPANPKPISLPNDSKLRADLAAYKWKMSKSGIQIRSKDEMKQDLGRSPDDGDAVLLANIDTIKSEVAEAMVRIRRSYDPYAELYER